MTEVYKYLNGLSSQITNNIFKFRENIYNLRKVSLFESQNPKKNRNGLNYRASEIWQIFLIEIRDSISLKNFNHIIKTWYCN